MTAAQRTAVLLDPHPLWLDAITGVLARVGVEVAGRATVPVHALALLEEHRPDLFVTEIETGESPIDGLTCLRRARGSLPHLKIIVLATSADPQKMESAFAAGALAYVIKRAQAEDLALTIRQTFEHSVYFTSARVLSPASVEVESDPSWGLTRRELEILRLMAEGHSNNQPGEDALGDGEDGEVPPGGEQDGVPEEDGRFISSNGHSEERLSEEQSARALSEANVRSVVLLDQHPLWLDAIEQVLMRNGMQVVGKARSPEEALKVLMQTRPYAFVAEIGVQYPEMDGVTCLREARKAMPSLRVIVLSAAEEPQLIDAAFAAGTLAYIVKKAHPDDVCTAIRQTFDLSIFFAQDYAGAPPSPPPLTSSSADGDKAPAAHGLTRRELEILQIVAEGYSNGQLAKMLWVTEQTVKFHLSNIYRKLDVSNRTEASRWAQTHNLLPEAPTAAGNA